MIISLISCKLYRNSCWGVVKLHRLENWKTYWRRFNSKLNKSVFLDNKI